MAFHRTLVSGTTLGLIVLALRVSPAPAQDVQWRPDYGAARREAAENKRPIALILSAEYCGWCKHLDATTLRNPEVVGLLNERFVPLKVAGDDPRNAYLVNGLRIQGYPAIVTISTGGTVRETHEGYLDVPDFLALLRRATAPEPPASENKTASR